jgi:hypothetical protein
VGKPQENGRMTKHSFGWETIDAVSLPHGWTSLHCDTSAPGMLTHWRNPVAALLVQEHREYDPVSFNDLERSGSEDRRVVAGVFTDSFTLEPPEEEGPAGPSVTSFMRIDPPGARDPTAAELQEHAQSMAQSMKAWEERQAKRQANKG